MTISAHDVAAALIERQLEAARPIDKLQLQKLLYLVQGVHSACWGAPAFREPIHAYRNGPVVRVVEETYRNATGGMTPLSDPMGGHPERLPFETADTVETVLRHFGSWTGPNLEAYTKRPGSPGGRSAATSLPASSPTS
ncbi:MAG TPA: type II toxin-antitoxin system antitoxin SocA domain-containing protein [Acidimicrobiales bacterium]|nr:type II toxin-antitoxin system antitoxin SocA domain-containing protein [Acidimicrobiales bacterium]